MSFSVQTERRLPAIRHGLLKGLTYQKIASECKVTERTINRDVKKWVQSGAFEEWIKEEWLRLHGVMLKGYPDLAYKEVSRLVGRMLTRKVESKHIEEVREIKLLWHVDSKEDGKE